MQFIPMLRAWNGVAFSKAGSRLFVAAGSLGLLYAFPISDGKAGPSQAAFPAGAGRDTFLAGIAVHPGTGRLYVCNEADGEVWVVDAETRSISRHLAEMLGDGRVQVDGEGVYRVG